MKIYFNNAQTPLKAEVLPSNTPTLDETLETFSFALLSNTRSEVYAPMNTIKVEFDDESTTIFYIVADNVALHSLNPLRYKHTITCVQNTRKLSKHIVRNTVFSQPANQIKSSYNGFRAELRGTGSSRKFRPFGPSSYLTTVNGASQPLLLEKGEKVKNAYIYLDLTVAATTPPSVSQAKWVKPTTEAQFPSNSDASFVGFFQLWACPPNSTTPQFQINIFPEDVGLSNSQFKFNTLLACPEIIDYINDGYTNLELRYPTNVNNAMPIDINMGYSFDGSESKPVGYFYNAKIVVETYFHDCYEILDLLIKRQQRRGTLRNHDSAELEYARESDPLFYLPTEDENPELYNLLKSTVAPNFTFTQLTMYECVAEVFRLFDAIFTLDENNVLGIEYFNNLNNKRITPRLTGVNVSLGEDKYTNGLLTYYQDGRNRHIFPDRNNFVKVRGSQVGLPSDPSDHYFITDHPIQSIEKLEVYVDVQVQYDNYGGGSPTDVTIDGFALDITPFVFEKEIWSTLPVGDYDETDSLAIKQINTISFDQGTNLISVGYTQKNSWGLNTKYSMWNAIKSALCLASGITANRYLEGGGVTYNYYLFSPNTSNNAYCDIEEPDEYNYNDIKMRCTYMATVNGATKVVSSRDKYIGESLVDQINGAVDLNKLCLNIYGASLKLGQPTLNATHRISNWEDRIKVGEVYQKDGEVWVANVCSYTILGNGYLQGKVSFVKNFNALALRTQLVSERRMSNVSKELTAKSEDVIIDYIIYSTTTYTQELENRLNHIYLNYNYIERCLTHSFISDGNFEGVIGPSVFIKDNDYIYLPLITYGDGNTACFEFTFYHPLSAGNSTVAKSSTWYGSTSYYTSPVFYAEDNGMLEKASIKVVQAVPEAYDQEFPKFTTPPTGQPYIEIVDYMIYKQPNEVFALNYELCFLPRETQQNIDFLYSAFIKKSFFVQREIRQPRSLKIYLYTDDVKFSTLDTRPFTQEDDGVTPIVRDVLTPLVGTNAAKTRFQFNFGFNGDPIDTTTIKAWCLVDQDGDLIFASNSQPVGVNHVRIIFVTTFQPDQWRKNLE